MSELSQRDVEILAMAAALGTFVQNTQGYDLQTLITTWVQEGCDDIFDLDPHNCFEFVPTQTNSKSFHWECTDYTKERT